MLSFYEKASDWETKQKGFVFKCTAGICYESIFLCVCVLKKTALLLFHFLCSGFMMLLTKHNHFSPLQKLIVHNLTYALTNLEQN